MQDFKNQDPNITAPGVTGAVKKQGTYFGKLDARQIFENKAVRLKLYRVEPDGSVDLANGAQSRRYVSSTFKYAQLDNIYIIALSLLFLLLIILSQFVKIMYVKSN